MKSFSDRNVLTLAYFYVILPFIIFLIGWLHWYISIPISILVLLSAYFSWKISEIDNTVIFQIGQNKKTIYAVLGFILIWLFFSGIGGYSYQNVDHQYRNAIFQDLVKYDWPVLYNIVGFPQSNPLEGKQTILVYYLGYWLPAAIAGKIFGLEFGRFFLFTWTVLGLSLVFYYLCVYFKRFSLKILLLFICWGTLYFIGSFYVFPWKDVLKGSQYLWAGNMLFADGNTGLVYWTFNQTITPWLIILLILSKLTSKNIIFLTSLVFFHGPFSFIGLVPFVGLIILKKEKFNLNSIGEWWEKIVKYATFQNTVGTIAVMLISYLYFSTNSSGNVFNVLPLDLKMYLIFEFLSVGIIAILIFDKYKNEPLYYLIIATLLLLPFFQLGHGLDFAARVSIPAMFILMLLAGQYLWESKSGFRKNMVIFYLIMAGFGHNLQFVRSVYFTGLHQLGNSGFGEKVGQKLTKSSNARVNKIGKIVQFEKGRNTLIQNDLVTLKNPYNFQIKNFMGVTGSSFFYKYLAKKNEESGK